MTIEVRQLLIRSQVDTGTVPAIGSTGAGAGAGAREREQVKQEILAECKSWLAQQLLRERDRGRERDR